MRLFCLALTVLVGLFGLTACETTEGFGRDVSNLGSDIEQESQEAQAGL
ncbi:entericidin A/B family lipoprotein [Tritonibacter horizontis]|uniref:Entericidin B membrane lipoprotein n=1 Tax=Tritonibacter horizontis TaxID=1768241 RepID=A0A132BUR1_9RHOB|nr:entericidin A/B family lipoprotein [Tritonibacter horizontis]KUP91480.1 entericidin B membrane lipoprotein [Tritonibacter horizontis]